MNCPTGKNKVKDKGEEPTSKKSRTGSPVTAPLEVNPVPASSADGEASKDRHGWLWDIKSSSRHVSDKDVDAFLEEGEFFMLWGPSSCTEPDPYVQGIVFSGSVPKQMSFGGRKSGSGS